MRRGKLVLNGLVIAAAAWMFVHGTKTSTTGLLPAHARAATASAGGAPRGPIATDAGLAALEADAALRNDTASITKLAAAYLERDQPGLASAVIEKAAPAVRAQPEISHLYARALLHRGKVPEALAVARDVQASCDTSISAGDHACPAWLVARSARQLAFLEEMHAAGIEDPGTNPDGARAAFDRSSRQIRFVAMR
jgi:hypothetical protein